MVETKGKEGSVHFTPTTSLRLGTWFTDFEGLVRTDASIFQHADNGFLERFGAKSRLHFAQQAHQGAMFAFREDMSHERDVGIDTFLDRHLEASEHNGNEPDIRPVSDYDSILDIEQSTLVQHY